MSTNPAPAPSDSPSHDSEFYRTLSAALEHAGWAPHPTLVWGYVHPTTGLVVQPYSRHVCQLRWPVGGACKLLIGLDESGEDAALCVAAQAVAVARREEAASGR